MNIAEKFNYELLKENLNEYIFQSKTQMPIKFTFRKNKLGEWEIEFPKRINVLSQSDDLQFAYEFIEYLKNKK